MSEESNIDARNENIVVTNKMVSHPSPYKTFDNMKTPIKINGKLRKLNRIGGGTYGRVYEASIKISPSKTVHFPESLINIEEYSHDENDVVAVKRNFTSPVFNKTIGSLRELDILNLVRHHPYCMQLKDVSFGTPFINGDLSPIKKEYISDRAFFIMEKGKYDAEKYIHRTATKPLVNDRKLFAVQVFLAVEFLTSRGVYHRDIKPSNIICFFDNNNKFKSAKLTDYGLSIYKCKQTMSLPGFVTIWYRAPEISLHKEYDYKIDVWSLACILFELFASGNKKFMKPMTDDAIINSVIEKLEVSKTDYLLARQIYPQKITRSYEYYQKNRPSIEQQLNYTSSQIAQFNSSYLGGKPNFGTFNELIDLLEHMLVVDPKKRYSITECLNHKFFSGFKELIDSTRTSFGINNMGKWILQPTPSVSYIPNKVRSIGIKWFKIVYTSRNSTPINNWYSHRILFHAIEMYDRYLILTNPPENTPESDIVVWIDSFLFIAAKYFRVMSHNYGLNHFIIGIKPEDYDIFKKRVRTFEEIVIKNIFKLKIYQPTLYEYGEEFLTEMSVAYLLKLLFTESITPETPIKDVWFEHHSTLDELNRKRLQTVKKNVPVVNIRDT